MHASPGTWRRLKIAVEVREGRGVPASLPDSELVMLLGLLAGIAEGKAKEVLVGDDAQRARGEVAKVAEKGPLRAACERLAARIDVRPFL